MTYLAIQGTRYDISYLEMANPDEIPGSEGRNALVRRGQRNVRRLAQTKIDWRGKGLRALHDYELRLREDFDKAEGDYSARCSIVRTFCAVLEARRILVGDPLPGTLRPSKQTTFDAWKEAAVPALPVPISISQPVSSSISPPTTDTAPSVQSAESVAPTLDATNDGQGS